MRDEDRPVSIRGYRVRKPAAPEGARKPLPRGETAKAPKDPLYPSESLYPVREPEPGPPSDGEKA